MWRPEKNFPLLYQLPYTVHVSAYVIGKSVAEYSYLALVSSLN